MKTVYDLYFDWILDMVMYKELKRSGRSYYKLLSFMRSKQFVWSVDRDENRAVDGKNLRIKFRNETGIQDEIKGACSFLEAVAALARRMNDDIFENDPTYRSARWFWMMMENSGLDEYTDDNFDELMVRKIVDRIIMRRYSKTGKGGFFPLKHPRQDQREVEMWYQMQSYVIENFDY